MRKVMIGLFFLIMTPCLAFGQDSGERRGWGYAVVGVGGRSGDGSPTSLNFSGGGEGLLYKGFGLGAELGYIAQAKNVSNGFGILSVNASYHFNGEDANRKLVPFVTGGGSLAFPNAGGGNFGGGAQYWPNDHVGLRFEFRDHIFSSDSPHHYQFRVGVTFR